MIYCNPKKSIIFAKATRQRNKSYIQDTKTLSKMIVITLDQEIIFPIINNVVEEFICSKDS